MRRRPITASSNVPTGYEGYTSVIPKSAGMLAETLRGNGYITAGFGKWHLTPEWEQSSIGPFDRWPTNQGFSYFYGFLGGDTDQFTPGLIENTLPDTPARLDLGYILDRDLADHAIGWIRAQHDVAPSKPFFVYYATGTAHAPHSAPKEWLDRFRGKFDQGWDVAREQIFARQKAQGIIPDSARLTPRPLFLPTWASLSPDRKRVYARLMEAYAAALGFADHEIGRVIESLRANGQLDNTLIIFIQGDNGSSAEGGESGKLFAQSYYNGYDEPFAYLLGHIDDIGGPKAYNNFPAAWAWAMSTPFQYYKMIGSHFGGVRNGMVVSWPSRLKHVGEIRSQFLDVTDVVPTILEATDIKQPTAVNGVAQKPLDGISFAYSFDNPRAPTRRDTQVFEVFQNLGIYDRGWWAGTRPVAAPWEVLKGANTPLSSRQWELYNINEDFSQANDLAAAQPVKLAEMKQLFFKEAGKYKILPIHGVTEGATGRPSLAAGRTVFTFHPGMTRIAEDNAPRLTGRSFTITADVVIPLNGANGVLLTQGGRFGGYAFYVKDDRPTFHYNAIGERQYSIRSTKRLKPGPHKLGADFSSDSRTAGAGGELTLLVDGNLVAKGRIEHTLKGWISLFEGLDVGEDRVTPVNDDYTVSGSKFGDALQQVTVELR